MGKKRHKKQQQYSNAPISASASPQPPRNSVALAPRQIRQGDGHSEDSGSLHEARDQLTPPTPDPSTDSTESKSRNKICRVFNTTTEENRRSDDSLKFRGGGEGEVGEDEGRLYEGSSRTIYDTSKSETNLLSACDQAEYPNKATQKSQEEVQSDQRIDSQSVESFKSFSSISRGSPTETPTKTDSFSPNNAIESSEKVQVVMRSTGRNSRDTNNNDRSNNYSKETETVNRENDYKSSEESSVIQPVPPRRKSTEQRLSIRSSTREITSSDRESDVEDSVPVPVAVMRRSRTAKLEGNVNAAYKGDTISSAKDLNVEESSFVNNYNSKQEMTRINRRIKPLPAVDIRLNSESTGIGKSKSFSMDNLYPMRGSRGQDDKGQSIHMNAILRNSSTRNISKNQSTSVAANLLNLDFVTRDLLNVANSLGAYPIGRPLDDVSDSMPTLEQFTTIRLNILKSTSKLLDSVSGMLRTPHSVKLDTINLLCLQLKTNLHMVENFALELLSKSVHRDSVQLSKRIRNQLKILKDVNSGISRYLESLEQTDVTEDVESAKVKLGNIVLLTRGIPLIVRTLAAFVTRILEVPHVTPSTSSVDERSQDTDHVITSYSNSPDILDTTPSFESPGARATPTSISSVENTDIDEDMNREQSIRVTVSESPELNESNTNNTPNKCTESNQNHEIRFERNGHSTAIVPTTSEARHQRNVVSGSGKATPYDVEFLTQDRQSPAKQTLNRDVKIKNEERNERYSRSKLLQADFQKNKNENQQTYGLRSSDNLNGQNGQQIIIDSAEKDRNSTSSGSSTKDTLAQRISDYKIKTATSDKRQIHHQKSESGQATSVEIHPRSTQTLFTYNQDTMPFTGVISSKSPNILSSTIQRSSQTGTGISGSYSPQSPAKFSQPFARTSDKFLPGFSLSDSTDYDNISSRNFEYSTRPTMDSVKPPDLPPKMKDYQKIKHDSAFDSDPLSLVAMLADDKSRRHSASLQHISRNSQSHDMLNNSAQSSSRASRQTERLTVGGTRHHSAEKEHSRSTSGFLSSPERSPMRHRAATAEGSLMMHPHPATRRAERGSQRNVQQSRSQQQLVKDQLPDSWMSFSDLSTPDVRTSGVSSSVQRELEELRQQAEHHSVSAHTDIIGSLDKYEINPSLKGVSPSCLQTISETRGIVKSDQFPRQGNKEPNRTSPNSEDSRLLLFYCDQISQHWTVIDSAASAFFRCIDRRQPPKIFVTHSQFVILAGRKMAYLGGLLVRSLSNEDSKQWIESYCNRLCESLKMSVRATREAALNYGSQSHQQLMVDSVKDVSDWALDLKDMVFRLAYLSRSMQIAA